MDEEKLYLFQEGLKKYYLLPDNAVLIIGRNQNSDLQLTDSRISGSHCKLKVSSDKKMIGITDLNSSNGTMVTYR